MWKNIKSLFNLDNKSKNPDDLAVYKISEALRARYAQRILPLINQKEYELAAGEIEGLIIVAEAYGLDFYNHIHCSSEYLRSAHALEDCLRQSPFDETSFKEKLGEFETYSAQTALPKKGLPEKM